MADVLRFPPLPPIPEPPTGLHDERQTTFARIIGGLASQLSNAEVFVSPANVATGYRASALDLGRIQEEIEGALELFDMEQVRSRWDDDLFIWLRRMLLTWIQRCKYLHFDTDGEKGIHIEVQTQDDRGYYEYHLDVFPGRGSTKVPTAPAPTAP